MSPRERRFLVLRQTYTTRKKRPVAEAFATLAPFIEECTDAPGPAVLAFAGRHPAAIAVSSYLARRTPPSDEHHELTMWVAERFPAGSCDSERGGQFRFFSLTPETHTPIANGNALAVIERLEQLGPCWARFHYDQFKLRDAEGVLPYVDGDEYFDRHCGLTAQAHSNRPLDVDLYLTFPWDEPNPRFEALFRVIKTHLPVNADKLRLEWESKAGNLVTRRVEL